MDTKETTTLTLTNCYGEFSVTVNQTDMPLHDVMGELVRSVLLAAGYHAKLVDSVVGDVT